MYLPVRARWFTRSVNIGIVEVNYFAYYGVYKEGFGCFDCNGLFSLAITDRQRCLPKGEDPKAVWNSGNVAVTDCEEYFYPAEGNFLKWDFVNCKISFISFKIISNHFK